MQNGEESERKKEKINAGKTNAKYRQNLESQGTNGTDSIGHLGENRK